MASHDRETLEAALIGYEQHKKEIEVKVQEIRSRLGGASAPKDPKASKPGRKARKPLSPEARERIAAAQRKRWAKSKKAAK
jgi:hypothetical protein